MNKNKSSDYIKLVNDVAKKYTDKEIITKRKNAGFTWFDQCREINLWTYWQGWKYSEKTPNIDIMLVGQDWDNPFKDSSKTVAANIAAMNEGKDVKYLENVDIFSVTDINLSILFKELGNYDIINKRYDNLFFTNAYLGYKTNKNKVTSEIMKEDSTEFKRLCNIIEPKIAVCLGKQAYIAAIFALTGKAPSIKDFNVFLDSGNNFRDIKLERNTIRIYAVAHCGNLGTNNRNAGLNKEDKMQNRLKRQVDDWKKIGEYYQSNLQKC